MGSKIYIYDKHYPPFRRFTSKPQEKFYATWCSDCYFKLKCRDFTIKKLKEEIQKLKNKSISSKVEKQEDIVEDEERYNVE